ncbi:MAG: insulinase family protein [Bacteroidales bacterium]|nr:insulinase family protein [Bacteroidales bacterium]
MRSGVSGCGLRYAVRRSGSAVGYCALSIQCGTRDEAGFHKGIAHFVEHTLFRGTVRKSASVISGYLDRLGGELNAYTAKEEIVLHATVLKEDLGKAARLLFELATEATFPEAEIETERGVVLDEIISYKDNPAEEIYDQFEGGLFDGHPLGRPILGHPGSVRRITSGELRQFVATYFIPSRMAFTVVADLDEAVLEKRVLKLVEKVFPGGTASPCVGGGHLPSYPWPAPFMRTVDKHNHEVNAVIGNRAPSLYDEKDRIVASLLCNILGGPATNSLLNRELRERHGWVYGVECSYTQYADTGIVAITFGCDRPNLDRCLAGIDRILGRLCEAPLSERQVRAARRQLLGQLAIASDNGEAQCLSMGKSLLAWGRITPDAEIRTQIEAVTPSDLQAMACRLFSPERLSRLVYL